MPSPGLIDTAGRRRLRATAVPESPRRPRRDLPASVRIFGHAMPDRGLDVGDHVRQAKLLPQPIGHTMAYGVSLVEPQVGPELDVQIGMAATGSEP